LDCDEKTLSADPLNNGGGLLVSHCSIKLHLSEFSTPTSSTALGAVQREICWRFHTALSGEWTVMATCPKRSPRGIAGGLRVFLLNILLDCSMLHGSQQKRFVV
jgi:hypothetical protein